MKSFLIQKNIKWNFISEKAPWCGGFYERLIGIVKSSLKNVLQKSLLTYEELYTVITEIESVMNSRSLTYLSEEEYQESLTPNHLIYGRDIVNDICSSEIEEIKDAEQLRGVRKYCLLVSNHFKRRFYNEYLNALQERHLYQHNTSKSETDVLLGDVVLIKEVVRPRIMWRKGRIVDYIEGRDEKIRGVKLVIINSKSEKVQLSRPLQLIIPLEIISSKTSDIALNNTNTDKNTNTDQNKTTDEIKITDDVITGNNSAVTRRRRVAAVNADTIRKLMDNWKFL